MENLDTLRGAIDEIDNQIVHLFSRRMDVTRRVGEYKQKNGIPVLDSGREHEVLEKKAALVDDVKMKTGVTLLYETIMGISRRQQREIVREGGEEPNYRRFRTAYDARRQPVENPRVVYQGEPGAYSEQAARNFFGSDVKAYGLKQFEDVFLAIRDGWADYGIVPIENTYTGAIRQIYDLLAQYEFYLVGETTVRVEHCLMAPYGATLDTITHVYSHEQGLFQSEQFLNQHPSWIQTPLADTAGSAKYVAETGDITKAAICSERSAEIYGLKILKRGVNYSSINTTRFVVVSPKMELRPQADKISTVLTTAHESGCLHEILTIFAVNGLNMVKLESRPIPDRSWEYMFFLEFTGSLEAPEMDGVLHELAQTAADIRVLGNFKSNLGEKP
ncbi:MAG: chorismate mutase [Oscillospiraceae bacterium]|nr:chorismate mutase [Oscillospiraceae bacterium]